MCSKLQREASSGIIRLVCKIKAASREKHVLNLWLKKRSRLEFTRLELEVGQH